ncbi:glycosyltransferase family 2 protein [Hyphomonas sp. KY3]|uniref:glycosyltransferase family 2 protein n=1 Tax=Hyphomonas sp. KY3 TaxID=2016196 RepID=UPI001A903C68|nr:glycosyltransferase family 2 protein [Hyphomonas sp. KY3]
MAYEIPQKPMISVIMANYNCEAFLASAIRSVLNQTNTALELILVDDGSSDRSVEIAQEIAKQDARLSVFSGTRYGGPAPVRNHALEQAKGDWVAIVDSDDLIRPDRLERMLTAAEDTGADILIDNLAVFQSDGPANIFTMFEGDLRDRPARIMESEYIKANMLYGRGSKLGYAKPLIRRSALEANSLRYNETMRIGEDYDLIVRLLSTGARMMSVPDVMYFYRKHGNSISHRLDAVALDALEQTAGEALRQPTPHAEVTAAHAARLKSIRRAVIFDQILTALKRKNVLGAAKLVGTEPSVIPLLRMPLIHRIQQRTGNPLARSDQHLEAELVKLRALCEA